MQDFKKNKIPAEQFFYALIALFIILILGVSLLDVLAEEKDLKTKLPLEELASTQLNSEDLTLEIEKPIAPIKNSRKPEFKELLDSARRLNVEIGDNGDPIVGYEFERKSDKVIEADKRKLLEGDPEDLARSDDVITRTIK
ncbi:MAG: hypothetical protein R3A13_11735 [Bdellovibrionota bacterium]